MTRVVGQMWGNRDGGNVQMLDTAPFTRFGPLTLNQLVVASEHRFPEGHSSRQHEGESSWKRGGKTGAALATQRPSRYNATPARFAAVLWPSQTLTAFL